MPRGVIHVFLAISIVWCCCGATEAMSSSRSSSASSSPSSSSSGRQEALVGSTATPEPDVNFVPERAAEFPGGFWFGTQNLMCVMGVELVNRITSTGYQRERRAAPSRYQLRTVHRLFYYRGTVFEWGTGDNFYHIGPRPISEVCPPHWELEPVSNSTCPLPVLERFTREYSMTYGPYNLFSNNCHHYANRLSSMLTSSSCLANTQDVWAKRSQRFWKILGTLSEGHWPSAELFGWQASPKDDGRLDIQ